MRICDWSSDVCSSDLCCPHRGGGLQPGDHEPVQPASALRATIARRLSQLRLHQLFGTGKDRQRQLDQAVLTHPDRAPSGRHESEEASIRSEEHTSELQSLMRISYAVFCLKKKKHKKDSDNDTNAHKYK